MFKSNHFVSVALVFFGGALSGCDIPASITPPGNTPTNCVTGNSTGDETGGLGILSTDLGSDDLAQSFKVSANLQLSIVELGLIKKADANTTLGGKLTLSIEGDSNNSPDGNPVTTGTYNVSDISSS